MMWRKGPRRFTRSESQTSRDVETFCEPCGPCKGGPPWPPLSTSSNNSWQRGAATEDRPYKDRKAREENIGGPNVSLSKELGQLDATSQAELVRNKEVKPIEL